MKKNKRRIKRKIIPVQKVKKDSLQDQVEREDEQQFIEQPELSGFVREYVPGEFPEGHLTEEERKNTKYVLVKRSRKLIGGIPFLGRYPLNQKEFEYFQEDPNRIDELEPANDVHHLYRRDD